jgi:hypothetical protein
MKPQHVTKKADEHVPKKQAVCVGSLRNVAAGVHLRKLHGTVCMNVSWTLCRDRPKVRVGEG